MLIVDETGFLMEGTSSAGVQRQYSGTAGRIESSQVGTFLAYASPRGHAPIDRELYLPQSWTEDRDRCRSAGIPDEEQFATKPQQAMAMLQRAFDASVPFAWVTGNEAYGQVAHLRVWLEQRGAAHVLSRRSNDTLVTTDAHQARAAQMIEKLPLRVWRGYSAGAGARGADLRLARILIRIAWRAGREHRLLARRSIAVGELAYYVCYGPRETTLADPARVAASRWYIEECSQPAKG